VLALLWSAAVAFQTPPTTTRLSFQTTPPQRLPTALAKGRKGFGAAPATPKKTKKTQESPAAKEAAERYANAKEAGIPEYRVFARPSGADDDAWLPVGCVTVPRSESPNQAIFGNLAALHEAALAAYPFLKDALAAPGGLEMGYNLAVFPDEPVRRADPAQAQQSTNPLSKWIKDLTNPINT